MRSLFIKLTEMPTWSKIAVLTILGGAVVAAGVIFYVVNQQVEWDDQPVMLRLLRGPLW